MVSPAAPAPSERPRSTALQTSLQWRARSASRLRTSTSASAAEIVLVTAFGGARRHHLDRRAGQLGTTAAAGRARNGDADVRRTDRQLGRRATG